MHSIISKYHFALLSIMIVCTTTFAQTNFEGRVVYKITESSEGRNGSIETFFKNKKIKAYIRDSSKPATNDVILIYLDSGIFFRFDSMQKEYKREAISDRHPSLIPPLKHTIGENKIILGYSCSVYKGYDSSMISNSTPGIITSWYADSLYFLFDSKYATGEMIPVFGDGKNIAMGFDLTITVVGKQVHIQSEPVLIEKKEIPDSIFSIPPYYSPRGSTIITDSVRVRAEAAVDSLIAVIDSLSRESLKLPKRKKSKPKKSPSKNTHTQPTKSLAIKPKQ